MGSIRRWRPVFEADGIVIDYDGTSKYRSPDGRSVAPRPVFCRNGHRHGAGRTLVGHQSCPAADGGTGHLTYYCRECGDTIYVPTPTDACEHRAFDSRTATPSE